MRATEDLYFEECKKSSRLEEALRAAQAALDAPDNTTWAARGQLAASDAKVVNKFFLQIV